MNDFFKRNLVWITIILSLAGVILSVIGIPTGNPVFFFVGVVLSIPTVGYLIYQVFIDRGKTELDLTPTTIPLQRSNITSIIADKKEVLLNDNVSYDEDLESLYDGYANQDEIAKRLQEITNNERERTIIELPEIVLPKADPHDDFDEFIDDSIDDTINIETTTNNELSRQREAAVNQPIDFTPEIPNELPAQDLNTENTTENTNEEITQLVELTQPDIDAETETDIEDISEISTMTSNTESTNDTPVNQIYNEITPEIDDSKPSLTDPNFVLGEPVMPQSTNLPLTKNMIIRINPEKVALRKKRAQEKKALLSQVNLERYLQRYFIETAVCLLIDRAIYKDTHGGIAPYNKYAVNKDTGLLEYSISRTKGRLYKFCNYLIDAERFITHPSLYNDFISALERGISLDSISETLHPLYRKKYKKDFILNLSNREDWDNIMILVYNNYMLNNDNFKDVFIRVPFEIPVAFNEQNIIDYLKDTDLQEHFAERFSALEEIGFPTFWDALYICFINSIKQKLTIEQLEDAILRNYKKVARALKRIDNNRRKLLKAS